MNRTFWLFIMALCVAGSADYARADITLLAGITKYGRPVDGTYWNTNQPNNMDLTPPAIGIRWDSKRLPFDTSVALQYINYGTGKTNALAVGVDAPYPGGYIPNTGGKCVGTCAPLSRWVIETEAQGLALLAIKHLGNWSLEWGVQLYETRTRGYVVHEESPTKWIWHYLPGHHISQSQVFGIGYQRGKWSVRLQAVYLNGPSRIINGGEEAPAPMNDENSYLLTVGYTF